MEVFQIVGVLGQGLDGIMQYHTDISVGNRQALGEWLEEMPHIAVLLAGDDNLWRVGISLPLLRNMLIGKNRI